MDQFFRPGTTLLLADGDQPTKTLLAHYASCASTIIACDGAASWAKSAGIKPDLVIGDLDSLPSDLAKTFTVLSIDDQDSNDLEKALAYCRQNNLPDIVVLGAFGGRLDHTLGNLFVLKKFACDLDIRLIDEQHVAFMAKPSVLIDFTSSSDLFISLYPMADRVGPIDLSGVYYPLKGEYLGQKSRIGTLNKSRGQKVKLKCASDDLLLILQNTCFDSATEA